MKRVRHIVPVVLFALPALLGGADLASLLVPVEQMRQELAAEEAPDKNAITEIPAVAAAPEAESAEPTKSGAENEKEPTIYVSLNEVLAELRGAMETRYHPEGRLVLNTSQGWKPLAVRDADWRLELVRVSGQTLLPHVAASFRIMCGDENQGDFQMMISCSLMREVLVATRRFNRGEDVSPADFQVQICDVLGSPSVPVPVDGNIADWQTRSPIGAGQILFWRDLEQKPLVHRGQMVEAIAVEGSMRITVKAQVMEDGREGDLIRVRNLSSNRDIQARILNEHTVQVYF